MYAARVSQERFGSDIEASDEIEELRVGRGELLTHAGKLLVVGFELGESRVAFGIAVEEEGPGTGLVGDGVEVGRLGAEGVGRE